LDGLARALRHQREDVAPPAHLAFEALEAPFRPRLAAHFAAAAGEPAGVPVVLVGHSGAGGLLPAIAEAIGAGVHAAIFLDAILPHPGTGWFGAAPPALAAHLRARIEGGRLPRWDTWFPAEVLAELIPDGPLRAAFVADLPWVPAGFCDEPAPVCPNWPPPALGYLQLSAAYSAEADAARNAGWVWRHEQLHHLAPLTHPAKVAESLQSLIDALLGAT
jgi:hypothetical protein